MFRQNVPLKDYSRYKIGGPAAYFLSVATKEDLIAGISEWREISENLPEKENKIFILGGGTNVLFPDVGFKGLVIKDAIDTVQLAGDKITVGAGTLLTKLLDFCIANSLSGLEWAGGLPGTIGGAVRGNAGAFGGETKDNVFSVTSVDLNTQEIIIRKNVDCLFSYRSSIFKSQAKDEFILSVTFQLQKGLKAEIENKILEKANYRKTKHPLEYPNLGSVFKNVLFESVPEEYKKELSQYVKDDPIPVVPTGKLIFLAGLKGKRVGDAMVSDKHTNFIVNLGNATAQDVETLIEIIRNEIRQKFGISLEEEIMRLD
jgi:UDP-N-acetylmuramate dehydrogenase